MPTPEQAWTTRSTRRTPRPRAVPILISECLLESYSRVEPPQRWRKTKDQDTSLTGAGPDSKRRDAGLGCPAYSGLSRLSYSKNIASTTESPVFAKDTASLPDRIIQPVSSC